MPPFASYAQTVRMLMPLARRVAFHDERGRVLWVSDGIEEAELTMQAQLLISRYVNDDPFERHLHAHSDLPEPVHVFPIRDISGVVVGAVALQFDALPPHAAYRSYATVQRMLAPLLDILQHGWRADAQAKAKALHWQPSPEIAQASVAAAVVTASPPALPPTSLTNNVSARQRQQSPERARAAPTALPAVLRHVLVEAVEATAASFGTIALPGHPFSFNHRRGEDESDLNVSVVADEARLKLLQWMSAHNQPVIINEPDASQPQFINYRVLAWPIRVDAGPLLGLVVLFRRRQEPEFVADELRALEQITAQIPDAVLAELQRIHTTRTLALHYSARPNTPSPIARTMEKPKPVPVQEPEVVALLVPERVDEEDLDEVDGVPPAVIGAPLPSLTERVRTALSKDGFELYAQRITPLHDYSCPERFEVLLRMPDKYGLQTPAAFMAAAESGNLLPALDLWVVRHTLSLLRLNNRLGSGTRELSVNLSAASLSDEAFIEQALAEIRRSKIKPGQLGFEVSESVAIHHLQPLRRLAEQLQAIGCRMTLDNCRMGVEIFDLLSQSAINCIKIDGSIVRDSGLSPSANALIESMVRRASECGIESVAEQVESHLVCSTIIRAGIDYAQGYHLEAPAPLAKLFY